MTVGRFKYYHCINIFMPKNDFENVMVKSLNKFYKNKRAFAYRLNQSKYKKQIIDILSDSQNPKYFFCMECKSIKTTKLYFNSHFVEGQIENETIFINKTGRYGLLAIEFRRGVGKPREAYLIPWILVYERYKLFKEFGKREHNGFSYKEIQTIGKKLKREKGLYLIEYILFPQK